MENTKQNLQDAIKQVQSQIEEYNSIPKITLENNIMSFDGNILNKKGDLISPVQSQLDERISWLSELNSQLSKLG